MNAFTHRRLAAGVALVLATGVCAAASAALADAGASSTAVKFGAETWYQPDPTCSLPTGCVALGVTPPPVNPYGAGTLHVGVTAGSASATETSRTYLAIGPVALGAGVTVTKAQFSAPLDTSASDGSVSPETSTTHVCTSTATIMATEGEFDSYPDTNCSTDAPLSYVATPTAELSGDLTQLINAHLGDLAAGKLDLAIIPFAAPATATWNDVFSSDDRTSSGPAAPSLTLTFGSSSSTAPVVVSDDASPAPTASATSPAPLNTVAKALPSLAPVAVPVASAAAPAPAAGTVTVAAPAPVAVTAVAPPAAADAVPSPQVAGAAPPTTSDQAPAAAPLQVATVASTHTVGFAYPAILLLPLVLIAGGVGLARVMTRDVTPLRR